MKTRIFLLISIIAIAFSSCSMNGESNFQPRIYFVQNPVLNGKDTLDIQLTNEGVYRLDTIQVGDTVVFRMLIDGIANNLRNYTMTQSADSAARFVLPSVSSMDSVFLPTSNYNKGIFNLKGTSTSLFFPFRYVARKASNEAKIIFSVVSDANFEYNQASFVLKTPIVEASDSLH
ncbi:MAG: hypothetical protein QM800_03730 [Paludibacter sp.]